MIILIKQSVCFVLFLLMAGCCASISHNNVTMFKHKYPNESGKYIYINPVSLDTYYYLEGQQRAAIIRIALKVEKKYGDLQGLKEYVESEVSNMSKDNLLVIEDYSKLEKISADDGTICQFKWEDGHVVEMGMMVLKNGSIVERDVWVTDFKTQKITP